RDLEQIVQLEARKLIKRLADKKIQLTLSPEVIGMLVDKGYDPQYGARPMRRAIERMLEDPIAEAILRGDLRGGTASLAKRNEESGRIEFENALPPAEKEPAKPKTPRKPSAKAKKETPSKPAKKTSSKKSK
ncbi:MAG: hypothetical protein II349_01350, partial [Akkermansia sp.]|nr:hypothetical protein [Akkermansia sp.]